MQNIKTHHWCQKYNLDYNLEEVIAFFREKMELTPFMSHKDYAVLAKKSRYWDWLTGDIQNPHIINLLNHIAEKHHLPLNTKNTKIALWEYGEGDELEPHIDVNISLSSAIVIALVGSFETRLFDSEDTSKIVDQVIYGPGEYIILNNTAYYHGGRPLDGYRLAAVAFVDPSFDMTNFWS